MQFKWIGAIFVIAGCGCTGFLVAANHRRETQLLRQLILVLDYLESELQYRMTQLPELCRRAGEGTSGVLRDVFLNLARELDWQMEPDACSCMNVALIRSKELPVSVRRLLLQLGHTLGRFDLNGQLRGIRSVRKGCEESLENMVRNQEVRLRSYQTLGLCAGTALAILFA